MSTRSVAGSGVGTWSYHGALASPSFWMALAVLVLNDHVLKSAGVLPSWLTGKLSDFAGLIVGPVVAAALCPPRHMRPPLVAAGLVVLAFVATELSPSCATAVSDVFAWFGLRARLWPDVTDLAALTVLPWTWHLLRAPRRVGAPVLARVGLTVAALACVATTDISTEHGPFLVNHTGEPLSVEVEWFDGPDVCSAPLDVLAKRAGSFTTLSRHTFELKPDWTMRLDQPSDSEDELVGVCKPSEPMTLIDAGAKTACVLLRISAEKLPVHFVRSAAEWVDDEVSTCAQRIRAYDGPKEGALVIGHGSDRERIVRAYSHIEVFKVPGP